MVTEESTNSLHRCIYCKPSIPPRLVNDINLLTAGEANKHLESTSSHMVDISATHLLVCQKVACTNNALKCLATDHCQGSFTRAPWLKQLATRAMDLTSFGSVRFVWFSQVKRFKWIGPSSVCFVNGPGVCVCICVFVFVCVCSFDHNSFVQLSHVSTSDAAFLLHVCALVPSRQQCFWEN